MNRSVFIGDGLELIILNDAWGKGESFARAREIVKQGVLLQELVFMERGVSFPDKRVLRYEDSVGTHAEPGALDGSSPDYHHFYLLQNGRLVGMRASEDMILRGIKGRIVLDYISPLVPNSAIQGSKIDLVQLLAQPWAHIKEPLDYLPDFVATFTDGIGPNEKQLKDLGYLKSDALVSVPPLDAQTREEYTLVLDRIPMYAMPFSAQQGEVRLRRTGAEALLVGNYLKQGYIDNAVVRRLGLRVNELPCVVETRASIAGAVQRQGYVAFRAF